MIRPAGFVDGLVWALCVLCAISLQTQITLFASETYLGLRINLTDIIAPLAGLAIFATLLTKSSLWPDWKIPHFYAWLGLLTFVLLAALLNGWYLYGELSRWAIVNKIGGWFILLAIMGMGGWIAQNARQEQLELFLRIFLYFFLLVLIVNTVYYIHITFEGKLSTFMSGVMANRNAFAFLFMAVLFLATSFYFSETPLLPPAYNYVLYFFMPFFFIINGSRAGWICAGILLFVMAVLKRTQIRKCLLLATFAVLGTASLHGIYSFQGYKVAVLNPSVMAVFEGNAEEYAGDQIRIAVLKVTLPMIAERPVFGSGLGSIMMQQEQKDGKVINLLDNTGLWLVAETGIVGLIAFAFFYFLIIKRVYKSTGEDDDFSKTIRQSVLFLIAGFTIMCLFHELMYTRFLWFFLGLALALPSKTRQVV